MRPTPRAVDPVLARALALAVHPSCDVEHAAASLSSGASAPALRRALARVEYAQQQRASGIGERAAAALRLALEIVTSGTEAVPPRRAAVASG